MNFYWIKRFSRGTAGAQWCLQPAFSLKIRRVFIPASAQFAKMTLHKGLDWDESV